VIQTGQQARLLQKVAEIHVLPVRDLDRDLLVDPGVFGEVNRTEPATAEWREDLVLSDRLTAEEHWTQYTEES
jgi:hypothetical protein